MKYFKTISSTAFDAILAFLALHGALNLVEPRSVWVSGSAFLALALGVGIVRWVYYVKHRGLVHQAE